MATTKRMAKISNNLHYYDYRIKNMIISKLANLTNELRDLLSQRHSSDYPELTNQVIFKMVRDIRVWRRLATKIDPLLIDEAETLTYKK